MLSGSQIKRRKRKRVHGFLRRKKGTVIIKRRRKGRKKLSV